MKITYLSTTDVANNRPDNIEVHAWFEMSETEFAKIVKASGVLMGGLLKETIELAMLELVKPEHRRCDSWGLLSPCPCKDGEPDEEN